VALVPESVSLSRIEIHEIKVDVNCALRFMEVRITHAFKLRAQRTATTYLNAGLGLGEANMSCAARCSNGCNGSTNSTFSGAVSLSRSVLESRESERTLDYIQYFTLSDSRFRTLDYSIQYI